MKTYFAPAERAAPGELQKHIETASKNPVINELMNVVSGLLAVLNEQRQILAINEGLLQTLGIGDAGQILGLRPGEAVNCIHAHDMPAVAGRVSFVQRAARLLRWLPPLE